MHYPHAASHPRCFSSRVLSKLPEKQDTKSLISSPAKQLSSNFIRRHCLWRIDSPCSDHNPLSRGVTPILFIAPFEHLHIFLLFYALEKGPSLLFYVLLTETSSLARSIIITNNHSLVYHRPYRSVRLKKIIPSFRPHCGVPSPDVLLSPGIDSWPPGPFLFALS